METKKETDTTILIRYIITCADEHNPVPPMLILKEALALQEKIRKNPNKIKTAWDYIKIAQQHLEKVTGKSYWRQTPGYQVAASLYILMRVDGFANIQEEVLAKEIVSVLKKRSNFDFNEPDVEMTIAAMKKYEDSTPNQDPYELIDKWVNDETISYDDWIGLLTVLYRYMYLLNKSVPVYMILYAFLQRIPNPMKRVDVLGHLQDAAEKNWPEAQSKDFIEQASYLVHLYNRLHEIYINNPQLNICENRPDMNELVLFVNYIRPCEMVAIAQSIYNSNEVLKEYMGIIPHLLTHAKYINKLLTIEAPDFCKCLYLAHGYCMRLRNGDSKKTELPSIDNLDCEFRNACFDVYIDMRIELIKKQLKQNNRRLYPAQDEEAFSELCKILKSEYTLIKNNVDKIWGNEQVQDSMVTALQLLVQYAEDKYIKFQQDKINKQQMPIMNFNAPVGQVIAKVEQMTTTEKK